MTTYSARSVIKLETSNKKANKKTTQIHAGTFQNDRNVL